MNSMIAIYEVMILKQQGHLHYYSSVQSETAHH